MNSKSKNMYIDKLGDMVDKYNNLHITLQLKINLLM